MSNLEQCLRHGKHHVSVGFESWMLRSETLELYLLFSVKEEAAHLPSPTVPTYTISSSSKFNVLDVGRGKA
jgi:hypothetical protein